MSCFASSSLVGNQLKILRYWFKFFMVNVFEDILALYKNGLKLVNLSQIKLSKK
jgi:hypothetical protein